MKYSSREVTQSHIIREYKLTANKVKNCSATVELEGQQNLSKVQNRFISCTKSFKITSEFIVKSMISFHETDKAS